MVYVGKMEPQLITYQVRSSLGFYLFISLSRYLDISISQSVFSGVLESQPLSSSITSYSSTIIILLHITIILTKPSYYIITLIQ